MIVFRLQIAEFRNGLGMHVCKPHFVIENCANQNARPET